MSKTSTVFVLMGAGVTVFLMITFWNVLSQFMNEGLMKAFGI